ncbi:MAG: PD40 domain-containing protein [Alphaproteobacteria bacterium]|nr:PD40 domain-containing protein [Alphaproteobacteria bacterium]
MLVLSLAALAAPPKKPPVRVEAKPPEVLVQGEGHAVSPRWSPDGRWIAFEETRFGPENTLWMLEIGKQPRSLVLPGAFGTEHRTSAFGDKDWHPQGILVFAANRNNGKERIYFQQTQGGAVAELIPLTAAPGRLLDPAVGQGGELLALVVDDDLATRSNTSAAVTVLEKTPEKEAHPRFDPKGASLVFERHVDAQADIYVTDLTTERALRVGPDDQIRPVFADDTRIVYFSGTRDAWTIEVVEPNAEPRVLAKNVRLPHRDPPAVSPNGQWVAYGTEDPKKASKLMLTKIDGSLTLELDTIWTAVGEPALIAVDGVDRIAFTAMTGGEESFRALAVSEITDPRIEF